MKARDFVGGVIVILGSLNPLQAGGEVQTIQITLPPGVQPPGTHPVSKVVNGVLQIDFVPDEKPSAPAVKPTAGTVPPLAVSASPTPTPVPGDLLNGVNFDRAVAAVPAFEALGLSPESVTSPSTPRELAADLLNGVDKQGVLQHGIALETAPFRLFGPAASLEHYQQSSAYRWLYNFSVSAATSKAVDKSDAVQLAVGFKEVLYESADHDPYRNPKIQAAADPIRNYYWNQEPTLGQTFTGPPASSQQAYKDAVADFSKNKWQGTIWTAAIAPTWNSESGKISDLAGTGFTVWSAFSYGLKSDYSLKIAGSDPINVQFIGEVRYRDGEHITDPNDKTRTATRNTFLAAGRVRFGADTFNGFLEGGYVRIWHGLDGDGNGWRGAVGVEKKLTENVWLVLSAGEQFGETAAKTNDFFAVSSLRFGTSDSAQFAPATK
jgi:hypothetical protein